MIKGGRFTRSESHAFLKGVNSSIDLNCIYLSSRNQHHDFTSVIFHEVPNCNSSQVVRGVLNDKSSGVFQGKVIVNKSKYVGVTPVWPDVSHNPQIFIF